MRAFSMTFTAYVGAMSFEDVDDDMRRWKSERKLAFAALKLDSIRFDGDGDDNDDDDIAVRELRDDDPTIIEPASVPSIIRTDVHQGGITRHSLPDWFDDDVVDTSSSVHLDVNSSYSHAVANPPLPSCLRLFSRK